ncbi:MAG: ParB/RepB/Spo0J family partition protein [bacterium]
MSKVVLGKGIEALIPGDNKTTADTGRYRMVPVDRIAPNPLQPRRHFDETGLLQLAESFRHHGIIQPLLVRSGEDGFVIIAGERRLRAARLAGMTEVPVVMEDDVDETRMLELALVENLQREDLNPLEAATAYRELIERCGLTQQQLSERVGKSRTAVTNVLRLLGLPEPIKQMIREGRLSEGHARAILTAGSEAQMLALARRAVRETLSVRDVEKQASRRQQPGRSRRRVDPAFAETETYLKQLFGTSVRIYRGRKKGRIEIEYYGDSDLDRLLGLFRKISQ